MSTSSICTPGHILPETITVSPLLTSSYTVSFLLVHNTQPLPTPPAAPTLACPYRCSFFLVRSYPETTRFPRLGGGGGGGAQMFPDDPVTPIEKRAPSTNPVKKFFETLISPVNTAGMKGPPVEPPQPPPQPPQP